MGQNQGKVSGKKFKKGAGLKHGKVPKKKSKKSSKKNLKLSEQNWQEENGQKIEEINEFGNKTEIGQQNRQNEEDGHHREIEVEVPVSEQEQNIGDGEMYFNSRKDSPVIDVLHKPADSWRLFNMHLAQGVQKEKKPEESFTTSYEESLKTNHAGVCVQEEDYESATKEQSVQLELNTPRSATSETEHKLPLEQTSKVTAKKYKLEGDFIGQNPEKPFSDSRDDSKNVSENSLREELAHLRDQNRYLVAQQQKEQSDMESVICSAVEHRESCKVKEADKLKGLRQVMEYLEQDEYFGNQANEEPLDTKQKVAYDLPNSEETYEQTYGETESVEFRRSSRHRYQKTSGKAYRKISGHKHGKISSKKKDNIFLLYLGQVFH